MTNESDMFTSPFDGWSSQNSKSGIIPNSVACNSAPTLSSSVGNN